MQHFLGTLDYIAQGFTVLLTFDNIVLLLGPCPKGFVRYRKQIGLIQNHFGPTEGPGINKLTLIKKMWNGPNWYLWPSFSLVRSW